MLRCSLAALRKESFSHEIRILKVSDDKEWEFSGTSTVEVLESDKPTIAGIAVSKNPILPCNGGVFCASLLFTTVAFINEGQKSFALFSK